MSEILKIASRFVADMRTREKSEKSEEVSPPDISIRERSEKSELLNSLNSLLSHKVEPDSSLNSLLSPIGMSEELPPACTCDEKPYPHLSHWDGTGPGSGRTLAPFDPLQAHWSRNTRPAVRRVVDDKGKRPRLCLGPCRKLTWHRFENGRWLCEDCGTPGRLKLYAEYRPGRQE